ncbi:uncharacterized protein LOC100834119 isoform X1 [Brachypodium distachyon]|uniref:Cardiolipin synthase N-terminal domain-containing protein n=1 Tax=Brachypodium distachyon TaxID=15368 RepID=A0A0Q3LVG2_BRADI|nr:uncharacterized protein LOC100834119 isoform X1 [Brachypodium distachyon]KQJ96301.1 hypothetical protein BRADI_3g22350v3 [Brachypodium distachyon]|eukprot:XP_014756892.1 uncharacterized protein LOC100834119 isoform X1 [Brachypodium distachyon]
MALVLTCAQAPLPTLRKPPRLLIARIATFTRANAPLFGSARGCEGGAARRRGWAQICRDSSLQEPPGVGPPEQEKESKDDMAAATVPQIGGGGGGRLSDWTTSVLLFGFWAGIIYYVFQLAPNQTPYRDTYFLQKLLSLKGDDGFRMNGVLVSLWYIMGLWPLVYSMLLLPTGRRHNIHRPTQACWAHGSQFSLSVNRIQYNYSQSKIPVWPFLVLSCFGGAYALIPYFVLWKPPPPAIDEDEIGQWPLKFLESKLTAGVMFAVGLGLIIYAGKAGGDDWREFFQYFRESKFIHATCLDFCLLSTFSPFWVYNDMTARRWKNGSWVLPLALIPFLGPSLYLLLRPSLSSLLGASAASSDKPQK